MWSEIWNVSYIELRIWNQVSHDHRSFERNLSKIICLQSIPGDFLLNEIVQEDLFSQNAEFASKFVLDAMKLKSQNSTDAQVPQNYRTCLEKDGILLCGGKKALPYFPIEDKWCKLRDAAIDYQSHCLVRWKDKIHIFREDCDTVGESKAFREYYEPNIDSWGSIQSGQIKRECPLWPSENENTWHMMKNRISSYFVHS